MSTIRMRRMCLVGLSSDRARLIKKLQRTQLVEIKVAEGSDDTSAPVLTPEKEVCISKMARITSALNMIKEGCKLDAKLSPVTLTTKEKIDGIKDTLRNMEITRVPFRDFVKIVEEEQLLSDVMTILEEKSLRLSLVKSERASLVQDRAQVSVYSEIDVPFSAIKDTKHVFFALGTLSQADERTLAEIGENAVAIAPTVNPKLVFVAGLMKNRATTIEALSRAGFSECAYHDDQTAADRLAAIAASLASLDEEEKSLANDIRELEQYVVSLQRLYDYYDLELKKYEAQEQCQCTSSCFVLEAWLPHYAEEKIEKALRDTGSVVAYEFYDPVDGDYVPTLVKSNALVEPYESVTNMYSPPAYTEKEPNFAVAIFFFIYFGMMMSDAAYGLILAIGATVLLCLKKPKRGEMSLVKIILMGGISTFIWGVVFGGWFAITLPEDSFLIKLRWFNPLDEPLKMMILSVGLGFFQILISMGINAYNLIKQGKIIPAIGEVGGWYAIFVGIALIAVNLLFVDTAIPALNIAAYCLLGLGYLGLTAAAAYGKKGFLRFFGGLGKLYNITGYLSDVLSYTRLFGLGLSTGVVGMVANELGMLIIDLVPYVGYVIAAVVLVFMHSFNIAINTLGAYVHNCRLQFIEFFGRFYAGEGHLFVPLGAKTKYTKLEYSSEE